MFSHYRPGYNTTSGDLVAEYKKICPSWHTAQVAPPSAAATTPAPTTPAPAPAAVHFVTMTVTMPYSQVRQGLRAVWHLLRASGRHG